MKKQLGKRAQRTAKTLQLYACSSCNNTYCSCGGCASAPSSDYNNVKIYTFAGNINITSVSNLA